MNLDELAKATHKLLAVDGFDFDGVAALVDGSDLAGLPEDVEAAAQILAVDFKAGGPSEAPTKEPVTLGGWYELTNGCVAEFKWIDGQLERCATVANWSALGAFKAAREAANLEGV